MRNFKLAGGRIFGGTGWNAPSWCDWLTVEDGFISEVGKAENQRIHDESLHEFRTDNALVLPGLCDAHIHLAAGGKSLNASNLEGLNEAEVSKALRKFARSMRDSQSNWIEAFNWEPWRCHLDSAFLDDVIPDRPVIVFNKDLHSCCCNSSALTAAGIDADTPDPPDGLIMRSENGLPNGILKESAIRKIRAAIPPSTPEEVESAVLQAQNYLCSLGLTAVSEMLDGENERLYHRLDEENRLKIHVDGWLRIENWTPDKLPYNDGERFQLNTLKLFLDGALGSRTAAMCEPYLDQPDQTGFMFYTDEELIVLLEPAVDLGWRLAIHAIGDCAVKQACRILKRLPPARSARHRIEHAQVLPEDGVRMVVESGAVASIQPVHLIDDQRWLADRIGFERCKRNAIWLSLFEAGVPLALGTDWPVASPDPCLNLHASINRCGFNEEPHKSVVMEEALPPYIAIRAASYGWALAAGSSMSRGAIIPGQSADLTVVSGVSDDLRDWSRARVEMTICHGEVVYQQ